MKKTFIKISALSISLLVLATACTKTGATGPAGPTGASGATGSTGPNLSGNLVGFVSLYDAAGAKILTSSSLKGDSVTLTNNATNAVMKVATDSTGKYMFSNITTGNYNLSYSKTGFGTLLASDVQFTGGGNLFRNAALSQIPAITVTTFAAKDSTTNPTIRAGDTIVKSEKYIALSGTIPATTGGSEIIIYVSNPGGISASNSLTNFSNYYTIAVKPGATTYSLLVPTSDLYDLNFTSGNTAYFEAYVIGASTGSSSYVDLSTGKTVFTAINPTGASANAQIQ